MQKWTLCWNDFGVVIKATNIISDIFQRLHLHIFMHSKFLKLTDILSKMNDLLIDLKREIEETYIINIVPKFTCLHFFSIIKSLLCKSKKFNLTNEFCIVKRSSNSGLFTVYRPTWSAEESIESLSISRSFWLIRGRLSWRSLTLWFVWRGQGKDEIRKLFQKYASTVVFSLSLKRRVM